jgi:hypothetical protein
MPASFSSRRKASSRMESVAESPSAACSAIASLSALLPGPRRPRVLAIAASTARRSNVRWRSASLIAFARWSRGTVPARSRRVRATVVTGMPRTVVRSRASSERVRWTRSSSRTAPVRSWRRRCARDWQAAGHAAPPHHGGSARRPVPRPAPRRASGPRFAVSRARRRRRRGGAGPSVQRAPDHAPRSQTGWHRGAGPGRPRPTDAPPTPRSLDLCPFGGPYDPQMGTARGVRPARRRPRRR